DALRGGPDDGGVGEELVLRAEDDEISVDVGGGGEDALRGIAVADDGEAIADAVAHGRVDPETERGFDFGKLRRLDRLRYIDDHELRIECLGQHARVMERLARDVGEF